jgi:hypothetical protein
LASQINASNSGFGGIVSTGDSSGVLELQAAGTTIATIQSTGLNLGSNGVVFSDSSSQTAAASPYVLKNRIINGAMQVWQRGTSFTSVGNGTTAPQYTADRMFGYRGSGWAANLDISQQTGFGIYQYCLRAQRTSGTSSTAVMVIGQIVESLNMYDLQGQTITVSFSCRAGSNFSGGTLSPQVYTSTAANQSSASLAAGTWTGSAVTSTTVTPTTTATQYTFTTTIPSNALSLAIIFVWAPSGTAGANDYLDFSGVQLEIGTSATPFERRLYNQELANCQRYYYKWINNTGSSKYNITMQAYNTTSAFGKLFDLPVTMRSQPTATASGTFTGISAGGNLTTAFSGKTIDSSTAQTIATGGWTGSSGLVAGNCTILEVTNNAYIEVSAEL